LERAASDFRTDGSARFKVATAGDQVRDAAAAPYAHTSGLGREVFAEVAFRAFRHGGG